MCIYADEFIFVIIRNIFVILNNIDENSLAWRVLFKKKKKKRTIDKDPSLSFSLKIENFLCRFNRGINRSNNYFDRIGQSNTKYFQRDKVLLPRRKYAEIDLYVYTCKYVYTILCNIHDIIVYSVYIYIYISKRVLWPLFHAEFIYVRFKETRRTLLCSGARKFSDIHERVKKKEKREKEIVVKFCARRECLVNV